MPGSPSIAHHSSILFLLRTDHIFTNVNGVDPDVPATQAGDLRRISDYQSWAPKYLYQHLYLPFLYGFLAFKFRVQDITDTLIKRTNGITRVNPMHGTSFAEQIASKCFWASWRILMPLLLWRVPALQFWSLFVVSELVTGWWLAFNFQVSHVSPQLAFPTLPEASTTIDEEWAVQQVKGTLDYAHGNWLMTFLCGALNYQTVHHLFPGAPCFIRLVYLAFGCLHGVQLCFEEPGVSQYHYPAIAPIIKDVCKKHKVRYNCIDGGFLQAFSLHYQHLCIYGAMPE